MIFLLYIDESSPKTQNFAINFEETERQIKDNS
jgi:hypothetical protein